MRDPRQKQLAEVLVTHSTRLHPGERVLIEAFDISHPFGIELIRAAEARKAIPLVHIKNNKITRALIKTLPEEGFRIWGKYEASLMRQMQAYIGVRGSYNIAEFPILARKKWDFIKRMF